MNDGFISIHRKIKDWEWYQNTNVVRVFLHLLLMANYKENKWQGITIKRGQRITSYGNIATEIGDLSVHQVRTAIDKLKLTGELTIKTTSKFSVITINNYNQYQSVDKQVGKQMTSKWQTDDKQVATNNKENKENKENKRENIPTQKNILLNEEKLQEISKTLSVSLSDVIYCKDCMLDWLASSGKVKKDLVATLRNWIRREIKDGKIKQVKMDNDVEYNEFGIPMKRKVVSSSA